ncbi:MCD-domain-containing protein [Rozella allomycis CSF55]|uniref:MCD-domain-containing protein n=1 Tax=Rozella allomycis (strain CSF55) TaxID=988480 RepID=A0A4P9YFU1_ROZAC|nr:MCD-domain-containing protein [Rozella allomycis CSF55]
MHLTKACVLNTAIKNAGPIIKTTFRSDILQNIFDEYNRLDVGQLEIFHRNLVNFQKESIQQFIQESLYIEGGLTNVLQLRYHCHFFSKLHIVSTENDNRYKNLDTLKPYFCIDLLELLKVSPYETNLAIIRHVQPFKNWDEFYHRTNHISGFNIYALMHKTIWKNQIPLAFINISYKRSVIDKPKVACFYSITSSHQSLLGMDLGANLVNLVSKEVKMAFPTIETFCTFSPIPMFKEWLTNDIKSIGFDNAKDCVNHMEKSLERHKTLLLSYCACYLLTRKDGHLIDPVAHFHCKNGAKIYRINWNSDVKQSKSSFGMMVNYVYDVRLKLERSLDYAKGEVVVDDQVQDLLINKQKSK